MFQSMLRTVGVYKVYERRLRAEIGRSEAPRHIGIILDGNRRWAADHGNGPSYGHLVGADIAENLLDWCREIGIKSVTIYGLSTENLYRSPEEVSEILKIVEERLERLLHDERIYRDRVRVKAIGKVELLPETTQSILRQLEERTADFDNFYLNIAVAYGGRMEITDVVRSIASDIKDGKLSPSQITQETIAGRLYTAHLPNPEPDLIIRTSGEERLSNFLLWQGAYSELIFMDVYWPSFRKIDLMRAVRTYQRRTRRRGK